MSEPSPRAPLPQIPRADWDGHPRYPSQTLLLRSHQSFRELSEDLIQATANGDYLPFVSQIFERWMAGMRGHEHYEEHKLYPYLESRYAVSLAPLRTGHGQLHVAEDGVRTALATRDVEAEDLRSALEGHGQTLRAHLDDEERLVIPMLLELTPREFYRYSFLSIEQLLAS